MKALAAALWMAMCFTPAVLAGSSSCDIGQYWYYVPGALTWVSSGDAGVWAVNSAGSIFYRVGSYLGSPNYNNYDGRNYGYSHADGIAWQQVSGALVQLDSGKESVWGVSSSYQVVYRAGVTSGNPIGTGWYGVSGLSAFHVSVSDVDGKVWAVGTNYLVYRRVGISDELPVGSAWEQVPGISSVRFVDIGGAGVWATTISGAIYYRTGSRRDSQGSGWQVVGGTLSQTVSGGDSVWGVASSGAVYFRLNVTTSQPTGTEWIQVPGISGQTLKELSVSTGNNALWGVTTAGAVYNRHQ